MTDIKKHYLSKPHYIRKSDSMKPDQQVVKEVIDLLKKGITPERKSINERICRVENVRTISHKLTDKEIQGCMRLFGISDDCELENTNQDKPENPEIMEVLYKSLNKQK
jgi:hypothetical protein